MKGLQWLHYKQDAAVKEGWRVQLQFTKDVSYDVYIKQGIEEHANQYNFDMALKNFTEMDLTLSHNVVGSDQFSIAIRVNGYDHLTNKGLHSTIQIALQEQSFAYKWAVPVTIVVTLILCVIIWWFRCRNFKP